jgi:Zn-finger nucleic acid-binding protein
VDCPVCKEPMIVLELDEVEIDHCPSCQGIWMDAGELELILGDCAEKEAFLSSFQVEGHSKERGRKCPLCSRRMEKVLVGADREVRVDRCRGRDGIWLDGGELEEILEMASFGPDRRVLHLLKSMFAKRHDR